MKNYTFWFGVFSILLILEIILAVVSIVLSRRKRKKHEKYGCCRDGLKDYDPMYVTGQPVAGTVYASYPEDTPGLGWIV